MKAKPKSKITRRNLSFADDVYQEAKRQAKAAHRSVSNYLETLVLAQKSQ